MPLFQTSPKLNTEAGGFWTLKCSKYNSSSIFTPYNNNSECFCGKGFCAEPMTNSLMRVPGDDSLPSHRCRVGGCRRGWMAISLSAFLSLTLLTAGDNKMASIYLCSPPPCWCASAWAWSAVIRFCLCINEDVMEVLLCLMIPMVQLSDANKGGRYIPWLRHKMSS